MAFDFNLLKGAIGLAKILLFCWMFHRSSKIYYMKI